MNPLARYFDEQEEPAKGCLFFLRRYLLGLDPRITESIHYGMPFFSINGKRCCYLWLDKKTRLPYVGIVEGKRVHHPDLLQGKRTRMKILLIDPKQDMPLEKLQSIMQQVLALYQ